MMISNKIPIKIPIETIVQPKKHNPIKIYETIETFLQHLQSHSQHCFL